MVTYRHNSKRSAAWFLALLFNALLFILPIIAARVIIIAFASEGIGQSPTPEALTETRRNIEAQLENLRANDNNARSNWANLIDQELQSKDLSAARGFLLAAPQMLNKEDINAVRAAANAEVTGTEDERLARAALLFLPNATRDKYAAASRPPSIEIEQTEAEDATISGEIPDASSEEANLELVTPIATRLPTPSAAQPSFSLLGDLEDLAANSRNWINGDDTNTFILRLTGLAALNPETPPSVNLPEAASLIKGAHRAGRISPAYLNILQARLDDVLPESELRPRLEAALSEVAPMSVLGKRVKNAFEETYDPTQLPRLTLEIELLNRIVDATSTSGAMSLLEHVESLEDMRRARLIAEAGGDRASALVKSINGDALDLARSGIQITGPLVLQIMMLVATALALTLAFFAILQRSFSGRVRKAAIY